MNFERKYISNLFDEHIRVVTSSKEELTNEIYLVTSKIIEALERGNKILLIGNGGSAADSQHIAAEFVARFENERVALPAIALTTDTSILTALGNDYSFNDIYSRQIEALGDDGDVCIGISTSGNSQNIINALNKANEKSLLTIGFLGKDGGIIKNIVDIPLIIPSNITARTQEIHILLGHIICSLVDCHFKKTKLNTKEYKNIE